MSGPGVAPAPANGAGSPSAANSAAVPVQGGQPAIIVVYPPNYWEHATLLLKKDSLDNNGAKTIRGKTANVPGDYVTQLQRDLITLGYLNAKDKQKKPMDNGSYGGKTIRAVARFQRAAARPWRMPRGSGKQADATAAELFKGAETGECDQATAKEVRKWIDKEWKLPLGRFPFRALKLPEPGPGQLREDVATLWETAADEIRALGGMIDGPYGQTTRGLSTHGTSGSSGYSYHYTGRAIDIHQGKYVHTRETNPADAARPFWRVYSKCKAQDGTQGYFVPKKTMKAWLWRPNSATGGGEYDFPEGWYVDVTAALTARRFERIGAQKGWETEEKKQEWWHFQYAEEKEKTFLDEMELAGFSEDQLRKSGWPNDADLDHAAG